MKDGSLSSVYNIRGKDEIPTLDNLFNSLGGYSKDRLKVFDGNKRQFILSNEDDYQINSAKNLENTKGVIRLNFDSEDATEPVYSIGVFIPEDVIDYLKGKISGFFIVRQRRIPNILG